MNKLKSDIMKGSEDEIIVQKILIDYGIEAKKTTKNHCMDFETDNFYFELKSRRVVKDRYETTIIGVNKIEFAKKTDRKCIFLFLFLDGLYFYEYDKDDKRNKIERGGRIDRGFNEYKPYFHIPISSLNKIEKINEILKC